MISIVSSEDDVGISAIRADPNSAVTMELVVSVDCIDCIDMVDPPEHDISS
jgi:hypothetical protein